MPLFAQDVIHKFEVGSGNRLLKIAVAVVAIIALALFYDMAAFRNFSTAEAMDAAQLGRNISEGKGYTTDFVRPFSIYLFRKQTTGTTNGVFEAIERSPDISAPPAYPLLLAGILKMMPFPYPDLATSRSFSTYSPELWITGFNQIFLLLCAMLVFALARRLFDEPVAWVSATTFAGAELFWRYSISGLPTLWLAFVILILALLLVRLDTKLRDPDAAHGAALPAAAAMGIVAALAGMTRYAFLLLIIPLVIYLVTLPSPRRVTLALLATICFLAVTVPWLARNYSVSGTLFGTAGFAALQDIAHFPGDSLYRSTRPDFSTVSTSDVARKVLVNLRDIVANQIPKLGGSWATALFLAGLLVPFRNPVASRMRFLLLGLLAMFALAQAALLPAASPGEVHSNDYLIVLAPVVFIFGISLLFNLLEQFATAAVRYVVLAGFFGVVFAPLTLVFAAPPSSPLAYPPYYPPWIGAKARHLTTNEWMMSDMPWAVAWYGDRKSVWLTPRYGNPEVGAANDFYSIYQHKPLKALHLSARTLKDLDTASIAAWRRADAPDPDFDRFQSQVRAIAREAAPAGKETPVLDALMEVYSLADKHWVRGGGTDWESFVLGIYVTREVPTGFPLKVAPEGLESEIFLVDSERSAEKTIKPTEQTREP